MTVPLRSPVPGPSTAPFGVLDVGIPDLQRAMADGRVTAVGLAESYLARITAFDQSGPQLNSMIRLNPSALVEAARMDSLRRAGHLLGPLHGIPVVVKDNYDTSDMPTTAGAVALSGNTSAVDAFVVSRLRKGGAVLLGKTNMNEFALGITTYSSITGQTRNPYAPSRYPGGSSGGTAVAVAASFAAVGWGTDTCGSIRVPAAFNNLFALRPTKGLTSIAGIVPLCQSQDVTAPIARTVTDLAIALDYTVGLDAADPASRTWMGQALPAFQVALDTLALRGVRLGVVRSLFGTGDRDAEPSALVDSALRQMQAAGATLVEIKVSGLDSAAMTASVIAYEFRENLESYLRAHPTAPVQSLSAIISRGLYLQNLAGIYDSLAASPGTNSPAYRTALARRDSLQGRLLQLLQSARLDALVFPTARAEASLIGDIQDDPNCELSANSGFPAMSIPIGLTRAGTPVGMELLGAPLTDARLVGMAYAWEQVARPRRAPSFTPQLGGRMAPPPIMFSGIAKDGDITGTVRLSFTPGTGALRWQWSVTGLDSAQLLSVTLHEVASPAPGLPTGPVVAVLGRPDVGQGTGEVVLDANLRAALHGHRLYVVFTTVKSPGGTMRTPLLSP